MTPLKDEITAYHRLVGEIITSNVSLENWLQTVLWRALEGHLPEPHKMASDLLDTHKWTKGKITLCNTAVKNLLTLDLLRTWNDIYADISQLNTFRGDIAHSELIIMHDGDDQTIKAFLKKGSKDVLEKGWDIKMEKLEAELARYHKVFRKMYHLTNELAQSRAAPTI